jgi:hypothetical protein
MATPADTAVLLDVMCGGLTSILRMVGYDTAYALDRGVEADDAVRNIATSEGRVLVTRDEALAAATPEAVLLYEKETDDQLAELADHGFALTLTEPVRCSACNGRVEAVPGDASTPEYAPDPAEKQCWRCRDCGRVYWIGSHWADVERRLENL